MAEFLVVYGYGMGGVWGFATADSEVDIQGLSPELTIVHEKPAWMTEEIESGTRAVSSFVVGDETTYFEWLHLLMRRR